MTAGRRPFGNVALLLAMVLAMAAPRGLTQDGPLPVADQVKSPYPGTPARTYELSAAQQRQLPEIGRFLRQPSDQFLIDFENARTGHPYRGRRLEDPHTGCHVTFQIPRSPLDPTAPETYPAIYAIADGYVTRIDEAFRLRPIPAPRTGKPVSNVRYGIDLAIATSRGRLVTFHYSIEPMIDPGDPEFYKPFLRVAVGQRVRKGDVLATMYLPNDADASQASHIHFNLICGRQFQSPSIFSEEIARRFHACWTEQDRERFSPRMGQGLEAEENPFGTGQKEAL